MFVKWIVALLSAFLLVPVCSATVSAEHVASQYGHAVAAENWSKAASFFSSSDLTRIRVGFHALLDNRSFQLSFFPGMTKQDIETLTDVEFVSGVFGYFFKSMRSRGVTIEMMPPQILGSVAESATTSHVVYRQQGVINRSPVSVVDITTMHKSNDRWHVTVPEEFDSFAEVVKNRLTRRAK